MSFSVSTHSHPKVAAKSASNATIAERFQHTATRRWLPRPAAKKWPRPCFNTQPPEGGCADPPYWQAADYVSAHSHPKVAASLHTQRHAVQHCFNTQPPEGGCTASGSRRAPLASFQHTATRRWLLRRRFKNMVVIVFQHTATRRWLLCRNRFMAAVWRFQHTATRRWLRTYGHII